MPCIDPSVENSNFADSSITPDQPKVCGQVDRGGHAAARPMLALEPAAQGRDHLAGEQADRLQAFRAREVAKANRPTHNRIPLSSCDVRNSATAVGEPAMPWPRRPCRSKPQGEDATRAAMARNRNVKLVSLDQIGAARKRHGLGVGREQRHKRLEPELGERDRSRVDLCAITWTGRCRDASPAPIEAHHIEIVPCRPLALRHCGRRTRSADGGVAARHFHRHTVEAISLAGEVENVPVRPLSTSSTAPRRSPGPPRGRCRR